MGLCLREVPTRTNLHPPRLTIIRQRPLPTESSVVWCEGRVRGRDLLRRGHVGPQGVQLHPAGHQLSLELLELVQLLLLLGQTKAEPHIRHWCTSGPTSIITPTNMHI